jgi:hypothetical protein
MFLAAQIPLADARAFLPVDTSRLNVPPWPIPSPGQFMRGFGRVETRRRGGVSGWNGEEIYCRAANAVKFAPRVPARCAFRRFLSDGGAVSRLEMGLRLSTAARVDSQTCLQLIQSALQLTVKVPSAGGVHKGPLIGASKAIAAHYLHSTTRQKPAPAATQGWWIVPGQPLILLEYEQHRVASLPRFTRRITTLDDAGIELSHCRVEHSGQRIGVWLMALGDGADRDVARRLRLHLFRLHAERECLKQILRLITQGQLAAANTQGQAATAPGNVLQQYLLGAADLFSAKPRFGLPQPEILSAAYGFDDLVTEGERTTLLVQLTQIRNSVKRSVAAYTQPPVDGEAAVYIFENSNVSISRETRIGAQTVTNNKIEIGDHATITNSNIAVAESIVDSLKNVQTSGASDDLKKALKELHEAVAEMAKRLPEAQAKTVAQDLQTLSTEAVSNAPRRKWYELSADGLLDAAKTVAGLGEPVAKAVKVVLSLLV